MIETLSEQVCFDGVQGSYRHDSKSIGLPMRFSVFTPAHAKQQRLPVLFYLAGLTCNEETFMIKAGAQRFAAQHGIVLVACDTSPRNAGLPGEDADWDFGVGAGFYVNATRPPWSAHYRMHDYVAHELPDLIAAHFPVRLDRAGIFGHSMGGHGALTLALLHPERFQSVSAFAPIAAASLCPWGVKAFSGYLGVDEDEWLQYDASALMKTRLMPFPDGILIDQGLVDKFLNQQLMPEHFEAACELAGQPLTLRRHPGYDHSYYFVSTFIEDHMAFHNANFKRLET